MIAEELRHIVDELGGPPEPASRLRLEFDRRLGPAETARHRRELHLVIAAIEEQLPAQLRSGGAGSESCRRASQQLAAARGWTSDAATFAVNCWAYALHLHDVVPAFEQPGPTGLDQTPTMLPPTPGPDATVLPGA